MVIYYNHKRKLIQIEQQAGRWRRERSGQKEEPEEGREAQACMAHGVGAADGSAVRRFKGQQKKRLESEVKCQMIPQTLGTT